MTLSEPKLIDTHAHICDPGFDEDRDAVLERARQAGVKAIIAVGEDLADARKNVALARKYPILKPAAGLYPTHLDLEQAHQMADFLRDNKSRMVAIGEVGLDYWVVKEDSKKALQREILKIFVELSKELNLPLNIHSRSAGRHAIALLLENNAARVQMHAFDGKAAAALPAVEAGYFFSIPPSVIRSRQKQKLVKRLPLSCLLIETDSPVLGPAPNERNEPANIWQSIKAIAELKDISEEEVVAAVCENTTRLYGPLESD
ncbi:MAG: TatD family hydrolase [Deltaproteobacteria bacterium]|nr:TatD family hydrolase [Deltaproteobacteria bacterium]